MKRRFPAWLFTGFLLLGLFLATGVRPGVASTGGLPTNASVEAIASLSQAVEELVMRSKPADWPMARSCLYYALAGQHLLARHGIPTRLWVGAVVYAPATPAAHSISPHAWLETPTHFIDYATLPRSGRVSIIPWQEVAGAPSEVMPGATRVLALHRPGDAQLLEYITTHRARFARMVDGRSW